MSTDAAKSRGGWDLFLDEVTHGLRSPLSLVIGYARYLWQRARDQNRSDFAKDLELIVERARKMVKMIDQILEEVDSSRDKVPEFANNSAGEAFNLVLDGLSHTMRSPLSIIIGYSDNMLLRAKRQGYHDFIPDLELIVDTGRYMAERVNDLLHLHYARLGQVVDLEPEWFDLPRFVASQLIRDGSQRLARKNRNTIVFQPGEALGRIQSDKIKVWRVLANLLSNACKFTKEGTVTLTARFEPIGAEGWIVLSVTDTGRGMDLDQVQWLVSRFEHVGIAPTLRPGFGPGLSVCKLFCDALGGRIDVESVPGHGTTFTIRLPTRTDYAPTSGILWRENYSIQASYSVGSSNDLVLIVDDDEAICSLLERELSEEGFRTHTALGGQECLNLVQQLQPAAIVLDVLMPGLDGWHVLETLKKNTETANIPVIMASIVEDRKFGYSLGASDFLVKPFSREQLAAVLRSILVV